MSSTSDEPLFQSDQWTASGSVGDVRASLRAAAEDRGARILTEDSDGLDVRFGSRTAARLGGVVMKASRQRLPVRVRMEVQDDGPDGVRVSATAQEDPGWVAFSLKMRIEPYRAAMTEALTHLREASTHGRVASR